MLTYLFFVALGIFLGLLLAPYTGLDEWMQRKMTRRVLAELREQGLLAGEAK